MNSTLQQPPSPLKIMIPGGHLTPALGLIDWIKQNHPQTQVVFVGRKFSQQKLQQPALEFQEVSKRQVEFISLEGVKSSRSLLMMPMRILQLLISIKKALNIVNSHQPSVLMSFGGYMAIPLAIAAKMRGIPILTHEGTSVVGRANKILFKLADSVAYSYPKFYNFNIDSLKKPHHRTGTPLRNKILVDETPSRPAWIKKQMADDQKVLLVLGGSQGSLTINQLIHNSFLNLQKIGL